MMKNNITVVGMDVHKLTVVVSVLRPGGHDTFENYRLENNPQQMEQLVLRVTARGPAEFVYEAGPCGYEIHRQIERLGQRCYVIAPGLTPQRATDRVKTDRRDAEKLARLWRAGELTAVRVPTREEEASRDLVRAREDALEDRLRHRHRLGKFLLRQGRPAGGIKPWGAEYRLWLNRQVFEGAALQATFDAYRRACEEAEERLRVLDQQVLDLAGTPAYKAAVDALRCFKGIDHLSAITLMVETQDFQRFRRAASYMNFTGLTGTEWSSGGTVRRGRISKAGNAHLRRVLVEAAWQYRRPNITSEPLAKRRQPCSLPVVQLAKRAQDRLHRKFHRMLAKNKPIPKIATAVARELAGFVWAMSAHFSSRGTV